MTAVNSEIPSNQSVATVSPIDAGPAVAASAAVHGVPAGEPLLTLPAVAEMLNVAVTRVFDMLRTKQLLAIRINDVRYVPQVFFKDGREINKFVPGAIALLADGGYSKEEILEYFFTADDSLPGRPVDALHGHLAREVMRRAQAMAF